MFQNILSLLIERLVYPAMMAWIELNHTPLLKASIHEQQPVEVRNQVPSQLVPSSVPSVPSLISTIVSWVRNQVPLQDRCVFVGSSETCKAFHMKSHHLCLSSEVSFDSFGLPHIFDVTISKKNYSGQKSDFKKTKRERSCHCFRQTSPPLGRTRLGDVIFHL